MDNLINRQVAIDELSHGIYEFFDICEDDDESPMTYNDEKLLELINKCIEKKLMTLPAADTVSVVRCKDCSHSDEIFKGRRRCFLWRRDGNVVFENDFCRYGERRTDGTAD